MRGGHQEAFGHSQGHSVLNSAFDKQQTSGPSASLTGFERDPP